MQAERWKQIEELRLRWRSRRRSVQHSWRRHARMIPNSVGKCSVGPDLIVFTQVEANGNIRLLEPAKRDAH